MKGAAHEGTAPDSLTAMCSHPDRRNAFSMATIMDGNLHDDGGTPQNCPSSRTCNTCKCHPEEVVTRRMHSQKLHVIEIERARGLCHECEPDSSFTLPLAPTVTEVA